MITLVNEAGQKVEIGDDEGMPFIRAIDPVYNDEVLYYPRPHELREAAEEFARLYRLVTGDPVQVVLESSAIMDSLRDALRLIRAIDNAE